MYQKAWGMHPLSLLEIAISALFFLFRTTLRDFGPSNNRSPSNCWWSSIFKFLCLSRDNYCWTFVFCSLFFAFFTTFNSTRLFGPAKLIPPSLTISFFMGCFLEFLASVMKSSWTLSFILSQRLPHWEEIYFLLGDNLPQFLPLFISFSTCKSLPLTGEDLLGSSVFPRRRLLKELMCEYMVWILLRWTTITLLFCMIV